MTGVVRGFPQSEFETRLRRAQNMMEKVDLSALFLTTEPDIRYFTGFLTRFWESPTRPWYVIIPASGKPVAVIASIGAHLMAQTWVDDIRTWRAPDYDDDGLTLLADALKEIVPDHGRIGVPGGLGSHLRMPLADWQELATLIGKRTLQDDANITVQLRQVKSKLEIEKIHNACQIANRAFSRVPEIAGPGALLGEVFRKFQILCLDEAADWVPYLAGAAGQGGYSDIISPATPAPLEYGDVLMLDTGLVWDGYFCDFDRNYSIGLPSQPTATAHKKLTDATQAAAQLARPGATAAELFHAMNCLLNCGNDDASSGRFGHGLGMQLTEGLSLMPHDHTVLVEGMVLTLEPAIEVAPGKLLVHEENIVITKHGADFLSAPASDIMIMLGE